MHKKQDNGGAIGPPAFSTLHCVDHCACDSTPLLRCFQRIHRIVWSLVLFDGDLGHVFFVAVIYVAGVSCRLSVGGGPTGVSSGFVCL